MARIFELDVLSKVLMEAGAGSLLPVLAAATDGRQLRRLDAEVRDAVHRIGERVLAAAYEQVGGWLRSESRRSRQESLPTCGCGRRMRFKQMRPCSVRTALTGLPMDVRSPYYVCDHCRTGALGLRRELDLDDDGFTPELRDLAVRAGVLEPFESAATDVLARFACVSVSSSKVHSLCQDAGETACELMDAGELGEVTPMEPGEKVYVQIDGGMLHIDKDWHEAKLGVVFPQSAVAEVSEDRRELTERQVVVTLRDREELGERLYGAVARYLPKDANGAPIILGNVHVIGDGAEWITNLVDDALPGASFILDWFHVDEHIAEAARVLYEEEPVRKGWRTRQRNLLLAGKVDAMIGGLARQMMRYPAGSRRHEALVDLHRYLNARREQLWYRRAAAEGLYIGSGVIESANSHVLQHRMKRVGMRWRSSGARAMSALRCAYRTTGGLERVLTAA